MFKLIQKKQIYLDNAATTRTRPEVVSTLKRYFDKEYANPSSIHRSGYVARGTIEMAREKIAGVLGCLDSEIVFTGCASESNNLAIRGGATARQSLGRHIITSQVEHSSCQRACAALERDGYRVTYIGVHPDGCLDLAALEAALDQETTLVSLGWVNSEVGTIQDVESIVSIVKNHGALLHLDGVQALPHLPVNLWTLGADLVSFAGHKLHGPKGIGILYVKSGVELWPIIDGGAQEYGLRSGTENVPFIAGLARAITLNDAEKQHEYNRQLKLRDQIIETVLAEIPDSILTGSRHNRLPNHASFCFASINGKMLVKELSHHGVEVSSGAACSSPKNEPSHVLLACGLDDPYVLGSIRITLGRYNRQRDVDHLLRILPAVVEDMRQRPRLYLNDNIFISQAAFRALLARGMPLQLIDVRPIRYPRALIAGAQHIPIGRLEKAIPTLDPTAETVLVCYHGDIISPEAQLLLTKHGFTHVRVLQGGFYAYVDTHR
jgi:cysteine desulfurase